MNNPGEHQGRARYGACLALCLIGLGLSATGAMLAVRDAGVDDTTAGVIAGVGIGLLALGAFIAWMRRVDGSDTLRGPGAKRERMHARRALLLWVLPLVTVLFLIEGTRAVLTIYGGEGGRIDYLRAAVPVLYAWLAASVAMGWDGNSHKNRAYLEDELTQALRARAVVWAFAVLMGGGTVALRLGLWQPELGIAAIPSALVAAGATAAFRFAWLDREAGKDG
jgi:hypothetical protein